MSGNSNPTAAANQARHLLEGGDYKTKRGSTEYETRLAH